jgi:hypothetical protein
MRWADYVARVGITEIHMGLWRENLKEREHLEDLGVDEMVV